MASPRYRMPLESAEVCPLACVCATCTAHFHNIPLTCKMLVNGIRKSSVLTILLFLRLCFPEISRRSRAEMPTQFGLGLAEFIQSLAPSLRALIE
jgi:hypothetical protein